MQIAPVPGEQQGREECDLARDEQGDEGHPEAA